MLPIGETVTASKAPRSEDALYLLKYVGNLNRFCTSMLESYRMSPRHCWLSLRTESIIHLRPLSHTQQVPTLTLSLTHPSE